MVNQVIKNLFETTYRDDWSDSAGFHRILFNDGRALQARELTQMQTLIQAEITRFANNIFVDGAAVDASTVTPRPANFVKLNTAAKQLPSTDAEIVGLEFTGQTTGLTAYVTDVIRATGGDPDTLYIKYRGGDITGTYVHFQPGETIVSGDYEFDIQTTDITGNRATGTGLKVGVSEGIYYTQGRFVFAGAQAKIIAKYNAYPDGVLGFIVNEAIITATDDATLYDNTGAVPNTSSPGADRYKITLELALESQIDSDQNFVKIGELRFGQILVNPVETEDNYNIIRKTMALRTREESGDYIVKPFKIDITNVQGDDNYWYIKSSPGTAYVDGYRVNRDRSFRLNLEKPRTTKQETNEVITANYGNYVIVSGNKGLPNIDSFEQMNLWTATSYGGGGASIGTARVRGMEEHTVANQYKLFLFDIRLNSGQNFRSVRSIGTGTANYQNLVLEGGQAVLYDAANRDLFFKLPRQRPSDFADITLTVQQKRTATVIDAGDGTGTFTFNTTNAGEVFTNLNDWILAGTDSDIIGGTISGSGTSTATVSDLPGGTIGSNFDVLTYVYATDVVQRTKTLTEHTETIAPADWDSDGTGMIYHDLEKADIYSWQYVRGGSATGNDLAGRFILDGGQRDTYYGLGRLTLKRGRSLPSETLYLKYNYFAHSAGGYFFNKKSYDGQVSYENIPQYRLSNGQTVALRDVLDFRPTVNSSGTFSGGDARINRLPQQGDLITSDITYYQGRRAAMIATTDGNVSVAYGKPAYDPVPPNIPDNAIELYRFNLFPYGLSTKDMNIRKVDHRRYTMKDIGRLDDRVSRLEEVTSLSLLELDTAAFKVLDSDGLDRTKTGFFVDNFVNHVFSDTTAPDYRASLDPAEKVIRPRSVQNTIRMLFDSDNSHFTRRTGELVTLNYTDKLEIAQELASGTENVAPYAKIDFRGNIRLSPASDNWVETQRAADNVIDNGTRLSASNLHNQGEWGWTGLSTSAEALNVGSILNDNTSTAITGTSTSTSTVNNADGSSQSDTFQTTVTTTTRTWTEVVGENIIRETVNDRVINVAVIPFMRSRKVYFKGEGFRPNTKLFPFFDGVRVDDWCREESFVTSASDGWDWGGTANNSLGHPQGSTDLITDVNGNVEGSFFIPSTANLRFRTGTLAFSLGDTTSNIRSNGTTYGETMYTAAGELETLQRTVRSTRELVTQSRTSATSNSETALIASSFTPAPPPPPDPEPEPEPTVPPQPQPEPVLPSPEPDPEPLPQVDPIPEPEPVIPEPVGPIILPEPEPDPEPVIDISSFITPLVVDPPAPPPEPEVILPQPSPPPEPQVQVRWSGEWADAVVAVPAAEVATLGGNWEVVPPPAPNGGVNADTASCFVKGTLITMADGTQKPIENIQIGDRVLGQGGIANTVLEYDRPQLDGRDLVSINGLEAFMTPEHPLYTNNGWRSPSKKAFEDGYPEMAWLGVETLQVGDEIVNVDGTRTIVESIEFVSGYEDQMVYNLILDGNNTYYANNLLAHNRGSCFVKGTKVMMADGSIKNIEDVQIGEQVVGQDGAINTVMDYDHPMLDNRLLVGINESGPFMTSEHPVFTKEGWKSYNTDDTMFAYPHLKDIMVGNLKVGDEIKQYDGTWIKVESLEEHREADQQQVYNFILDGNHTYHADGLLVHNRDPLAQSFFAGSNISQDGLFVTKVDIFFQAKDENLPVWIELRTMENGTPTNKILPGSTVYKFPNEVNTSDDASSATTFVFDEPVYLMPDEEYSLCVQTNSEDYLVYIARVGDFILGTTERKINKRPFFGSLFKSQNARTWTPSQWEDLKMNIYTADFSNSRGTVRLYNSNVPYKVLSYNPFSVDSGDNTILVNHPNHGFTVGDKVIIGSFDSDFGGISVSSITGQRTITAVDALGYTFLADSSATSTADGGGTPVVTQNFMYDQMRVDVKTMLPSKTSIGARYLSTSGRSLAGLSSDVAYQKDTAWSDVQLDTTTYFNSPRMIANTQNQDSNMSGSPSLELSIELATQNSYVSPVVDLQRSQVILTHNIIDRQVDSDGRGQTVVGGYNVPFTYVDETSEENGTSPAKHITRPITLANEAVGLKVLLSANRPSTASFDVYYRVSNGESPLREINWTKIDPEFQVPSDENPAIFRDYRYLIGGINGDEIGGFTQFQLKVVMYSYNSSKVPVFKDLRVIALGV